MQVELDSVRVAEFGDAAQARAMIGSALARNPHVRVQILAALALARAGNPYRAQKMAEAARRESPLSTELTRYRLPSIEASIAIQHKDPSKAIELLRAAAP